MPMEITGRDITTLEVDAVVTAANAGLRGGGGVDGAVHRAAGPELLTACRAIGGCHTGEAVLTPGFALPARFVIHAVGPVWHGGGDGEPALLASCYRKSLEIARERALTSIAFPAISCGVYGYPIPEAADVAVGEAARFLAEGPDLRVLFVCFSPEVRTAYERALERHAT